MRVTDDGVVLTASDLTAATACEWAVLRRLDARLGRVEAVPDPVDAMNRRAAALGDAHEARQLREYQRAFGEHVPGSRGGVAVIERPRSTDAAGLLAARAATLAALQDGADVVAQAVLTGDRFLGYADFLLHEQDGWVVVDTKLARRARTTALLQLAAYAQHLAADDLPVAPEARLLHGDGTVSTHRLAELLPVYERRMGRLRALVDERAAADGSIAWGAEGVAACGRCPECAAQVAAHRDVLLVARLTLRQRERLAASGVRTIEQLAGGSGPVAGVGEAPLARLRLQARLQLAAEADPEGPVRFEVVDAEGLAALPAPDPGDVFFDFEGDPLWTDDGRTWGLEYLFGLAEHDLASGAPGSAAPVFRPFWAHDRDQERQALLDFLHHVTERRRQHPGMHVYHSADYERSHLQQLCARHGVGEALLDELLREHVLVDLHPVVLRALRTSQRSYGLKALEPLYLEPGVRDGEVANGADSVQAYVQWDALVGAGEADEAAAQLARIGSYNEADCVSTLRLRDFLLALGDADGVARRPPLAGGPPADQALARREDEAHDALLVHLDGVPRQRRTPEETALAMAAAAIEYHRREATSFWWAHHERQIAPVDEWSDQKDVLIVDPGGASVEQGWSREGRWRSDRRVLRLRGTLAAGSGLKAGDECFVMYDGAPPAPCDPVPAGQRGEHRGGTVLSVEERPDGGSIVRLQEEAGVVDDTACEPWSALPMALTPKAPVWTGVLRQAILGWGEALARSPRRRDAVLDLLRRSAPVTTDGAPLRSPGAPAAAALTADLLRLDGSFLAVQGPPGAGKTHIGAEVVASLVRDHGWRVGVVAQSHAVVENLLDRVVAAGLPADLVGKRMSRGGTVGDWTAIEPDSVAGALLWTRRRRGSGFVLGGTAWTFANPKLVAPGDLDLLVIDEAGQFSLANTIAVGGAARSLLLLGDPQQLPQVSTGLHPEPVDGSALGWLCGDEDVLPERFGVFLPRTWRMHPALAEAVSALSYAGRLGAHVPATTDRRLEGAAPGLHPVPVEHRGDVVRSEDEARVVLALVRAQLGLRWTDLSAGRRDDPLGQGDLIVVAPFNAQVALLREVLDDAGLGEVRVGTVDRFQGQEAVVAIVSLAASSADQVPRGAGFVLSRNRVNVAVSRARWATHLVHSPALADHLPLDPAEVAALGAFLRLVSGPAAGSASPVGAPAPATAAAPLPV